MTLNRKTFGQELSARIKAHGMTLKSFANAINIGEADLKAYAYDIGTKKMPPWHLYQISKKLYWSADMMTALIMHDEDRHPPHPNRKDSCI